MEDEQTSDELRICTPSHPLPLEIQQMEQEETTCRYCGVSYLILHEFQRLQERLRELEREREKERERELERERERELERERVKEREREFEKEREREREREREWERERERERELERERDRERELERERDRERELERERERELERERDRERELERERNRERERERELERELKRERERERERESVREQLEELAAANQLYQDRLKALTLQVSQADSTLTDLRTASERTRAELEKALKHNMQLRSACERQSVLLRDVGPVLRCAASELRGVKQDLALISQDWNTDTTLILQHCNTAGTALKQEVERLKEEVQKSHREREVVKRLLESRKEEEEQRLSQLQQQCDEQTATILSLSRDLRETEASWLSCQHRCEALKQQLLTWKRKEEETRGALEEALREGRKIRDQREALGRAQTEEMRKTEETFRKRLELAEEQGAKWRRDAALELDIERQKNEQLIQKHQTEYQQLQNQLPTLVHSATRELSGEVSSLKAQLRQREEEVKCVRKDSSEREEVLLREQRAEVEHLQLKLQELQLEALELQRAHREENSALHEEICLLEETVRRECEERTELTAALSLAREQLLGVRHTAVNSSIPRSSATSSLPSLSAGPGRSAASCHGNSCQLLPALPRLATERPAPVTEARHRGGTVTGRKHKRSR